MAVGFDTGWPTIKALVFRRGWELLSNTLWLTVLAVPISIMLGVTLALADGTYCLPVGSCESALAAALLAIPAFVQSYALGQCRAFAAWPLRQGVSLRCSPTIRLFICRWWPCCAASIPALKMSPRRWAPAWKVFFRVVLPQLRLAICGGALLVACICWRNMACM